MPLTKKAKPNTKPATDHKQPAKRTHCATRRKAGVYQQLVKLCGGDGSESSVTRVTNDPRDDRAKLIKALQGVVGPLLRRTDTTQMRLQFAAVMQKYLTGLQACLQDRDSRLIMTNKADEAVIIFDKRIGSDSAYGIAYLNTGRSAARLLKFSCKVMAAIPEHELEIKILKKMSGLVENGVSPNMPVVYAHTKCDKMCTAANCPDTAKFDGYYVVISELANCDLETWLRKTYAPEVYESVIMQLLFAVYSFHGLGYVHNDCHLGNFLIHEIKAGGCWRYQVGGRNIYVPNHGYLLVMWDPGLANAKWGTSYIFDYIIPLGRMKLQLPYTIKKLYNEVVVKLVNLFTFNVDEYKLFLTILENIKTNNVQMNSIVIDDTPPSYLLNVNPYILEPWSPAPECVVTAKITFTRADHTYSHDIKLNNDILNAFQNAFPSNSFDIAETAPLVFSGPGRDMDTFLENSKKAINALLSRKQQNVSDRDQILPHPRPENRAQYVETKIALVESNVPLLIKQFKPETGDIFQFENTTEPFIYQKGKGFVKFPVLQRAPMFKHLPLPMDYDPSKQAKLVEQQLQNQHGLTLQHGDVFVFGNVNNAWVYCNPLGTGTFIKAKGYRLNEYGIPIQVTQYMTDACNTYKDVIYDRSIAKTRDFIVLLGPTDVMWQRIFSKIWKQPVWYNQLYHIRRNNETWIRYIRKNPKKIEEEFTMYVKELRDADENARTFDMPKNISTEALQEAVDFAYWDNDKITINIDFTMTAADKTVQFTNVFDSGAISNVLPGYRIKNLRVECKPDNCKLRMMVPHGLAKRMERTLEDLAASGKLVLPIGYQSLI